MKLKLFDNFYYEFVKQNCLKEFVNLNYRKVFFDCHNPFEEDIHSKFNLLIYYENEIIGWSFGKAINSNTFYMLNTGILPQYQSKGIYSSLLPKILKKLNSLGFQFVLSKHIINSKIAIFKQKQGFEIIQNMTDKKFGKVSVLKYSF